MRLGFFDWLINAFTYPIRVSFEWVFRSVLKPVLESVVVPIFSIIVGSCSGLILTLIKWLLNELGVFFKSSIVDTFLKFIILMYNSILDNEIINMMKWTPINFFISGTNDINKMNASSNPYIMALKAMKDGVMPTALIIFSLIVMIELFQITIRTEGMRNSGFEAPFKLMVKVAICKIVLDNTQMILEAIFNTAVKLINDIQPAMSGAGKAIFGGDAKNQLMQLDFTTLLIMLMQCILFYVFFQLVMLTVPFMLMGRMVEMYIYIILSPLPFATLANTEMSSIGKSFIKNFIATSLQVTVMYVTVVVFSFGFNLLVFGNSSYSGTVDIATSFASIGGMGAAGLALAIGVTIKPLFYAVFLAMTLSSANKYARVICGMG